MSNLPTTFSCPHCGAKYPVKPALIGRAVRCSHCRKPFVLQANGVAEKAAERQGGSSVSAVRRSPSSDEYRPATSGVGPGKSEQGAARAGASSSQQIKSAVTQTSRSVPRRSSTRLNVAQERTRRLMSSTLNEAAGQALSKVTQTARIDKGAESVQRSPAGNARESISSAVLTGEGERSSRQRLVMIFATVLLLAVIFVGWLLFADRSPQRAVLQQWGKPAEPNQWMHPYRQEVMRSRALLHRSDIAIIADLSPSRLGRSQHYVLAAPGSLLGETFVWQSSAQLLVPQVIAESWSSFVAVSDTTGAKGVEEFNRQTSRGKVYDRSGFESLLRGYDWPDEAIAITWDLLVYDINAEGGSPLRARLLAGDWPLEMQVTPFSGQGHVLRDAGSSYRAVPASYRGRLLRIPDWRMPESVLQADGWVLLDVRAGD